MSDLTSGNPRAASVRIQCDPAGRAGGQLGERRPDPELAMQITGRVSEPGNLFPGLIDLLTQLLPVPTEGCIPVCVKGLPLCGQRRLFFPDQPPVSDNSRDVVELLHVGFCVKGRRARQSQQAPVRVLSGLLGL